VEVRVSTDSERTGDSTGEPGLTSVVTVSDLTKKFGHRTVVDGLSFSLLPGSITGFVGPNGAGKTTTIRMLLGLIKPTTGDATILGSTIRDPASCLSRVGALIEAPAFHGSLPGRANLQVLQRLGGIDAERVDEVLDIVGLADRAGDRVTEYSLGMKQRLGIAAALLPDPSVLILDEPTNGLDPAGIREVRNLLRRFASGGGSVLVSSHLLSEIQSVCDQVVMIRKGRLVFEGPLEELLRAQSDGLSIRTDHLEELDALAEVLRKQGLPNERVGDTLHLELGPGAAAGVNRAAFEAGYVLTELTRRGTSLEEAFFMFEAGRETVSDQELA
jgi:ABC-2 type transport system ATP-binding protein